MQGYCRRRVCTVLYVKDAIDMNSQRKLLISPHADDEVYGASSFIDEHTLVYVVGIDESKLTTERPPRAVRLEEIGKVRQLTKCRYKIGKFLVNHYSEYYTEILDEIEKTINEFKPDVILIPPTDTNQDHQIVHRICMTALRHHDKNHFVPTVLQYETPGGCLWGEATKPPNYFTELDLDKKIELYRYYKSQIRKQRSISIISDLAVHRGRQANMLYAEGFKVMRLCRGKAQKDDGK